MTTEPEVQELLSNPSPKDKAKALFIVGEVNDVMCSEVLKVIFQTDWAGDKISELTIYISSEGGSLPACFAIIDAIDFVRDTFGVHVTTFGLGETASAGFFLLINGDTRALFPNCMVFVHEHLTIDQSPSTSYSDRKRVDNDQDMIYAMYIDYTAKRLGITPTRVRGLLKKNRYLKKSELLNYNIITQDLKEDE